VPEYPEAGSCQDSPGRVRFPKAVSTEALWPLPSRGQVLCPGGVHHDTGEWEGGLGLAGRTLHLPGGNWAKTG